MKHANLKSLMAESSRRVTRSSLNNKPLAKKKVQTKPGSKRKGLASKSPPEKRPIPESEESNSEGDATTFALQPR